MSFGGQGEGARLLLGSDITGLKAKMVNDSNGYIDQQQLVDKDVPTRYMLAAGAPGKTKWITPKLYYVLQFFVLLFLYYRQPLILGAINLT